VQGLARESAQEWAQGAARELVLVLVLAPGRG